MKIIYVRLFLAVALAASFSACGGGGNGGGSQNPPPPPPVVNPPPTDPTSTAEWAALVTRLDIRFTADRNNLDAEQAADTDAGSGNYYRRARDRFIGYVDSFWNYAYNQTVTWSNASSVKFRQADVAVLLDDYRSRWQTHVDVFANNLVGGAGGNVISDISADMRAAIDSGYNNTMALLEVWLAQGTMVPTITSKVQGTWTSAFSELSITVHPNGEILGYDFSGCKYEGVLVTSRWVEDAFSVIMWQECGSVSTLLSGSSLLILDADKPSLFLNASSRKVTVDIDLTR